MPEKIAQVQWYPGWMKNLFFILVIFTCIYALTYILWQDIKHSWSQWEAELSLWGSEISTWTSCNVQGILLRGTLHTYWSNFWEDEEHEYMSSSDDILYAIESAAYNDNIQAVILEIDSYGWSPVAWEEIAVALSHLDKPSYAHIRSAGASAAYWAATWADSIFASKNSDVWSIGVTMSYLDYTQYNQQQGIRYQELASGKYKNTGSPEKSLRSDERALLQRDIDIMAENFVADVAQNRDLSVAHVQKLADGSTLLWEAALENGLIDSIAVMQEVYDAIEADLGEELSICWD